MLFNAFFDNQMQTNYLMFILFIFYNLPIQKLLEKEGVSGESINLYIQKNVTKMNLFSIRSGLGIFLYIRISHFIWRLPVI